MENVFGYIFKRIKTNEELIERTCKVINRQARAIRLTSLCVCCISTHMILKTVEDMARDKKIAALEKEIEEMKKGEQSLCWTS